MYSLLMNTFIHRKHWEK